MPKTTRTRQQMAGLILKHTRPGRATAPSGTPSHSLTWANVKVSGRLQCHMPANTKSLPGFPALTLLILILTKLHRQVTTCQRNVRSTKSFIMMVWLLLLLTRMRVGLRAWVFLCLTLPLGLSSVAMGLSSGVVSHLMRSSLCPLFTIWR